jgi:hypothetical protein
MCFNYKVSLTTFLIGLIFSFLLIKYGNNKYKLENISFGIWLIFIAFIQFMDFLFWIDISNKFGINKITSILGPILNVCQPLLLFFIKILVYKPKMNELNYYDYIVILLNILYFIYFIYIYIKYLTKEKLITTVKNGHLSWPWLKYSSPTFYLILLAINIFYLSKFNYSLLFFVITYIFLYISAKYFYYSSGELWCFFGSFIPIIFYFLSFYIDTFKKFNIFLKLN